ncbi:MAG: lamin tail domain-containing protein [Opitutaceae bacterium]|nr:lamin tail domain-containing protein [Opitutaceae bacterium]
MFRNVRLESLLIATLSCLAPAFAQPTSTPTWPAETTPTLRINEILATNTRIGNAGTFPDIIELHNAGTAAVDLSGMSLTDDPLLPRKFPIPSGTSIAAGGYLVVYADANSSAPGLHTGFSLDAEGDQVRLHATTAAGGGVIDSIAFGFQVADFSISRTGAGANIWALTTPTPGAANGAVVSTTGPAALKINEWAGKIVFRLDHDLIELYNPASQPAALGGVKLTDDPLRPDRFRFPVLSFIAHGSFLALYGADFKFGLDGDIDPIILIGANDVTIDQVTLASQPRDFSTGRNPDGSNTIANFAVPTPGMSNQTALPSAYDALLKDLRITELMFQPAAPSNAGDYEFIELQNIGTTTLNLSGVRFTNALDYTFPGGSTLAPGAFIVVARDRAAFLSRYPSLTAVMAPGAFTGALDNTGETIALTLPGPWYVHILRFRYEPNWYTSTAGGGYSLVVPAPGTTAAADWRRSTTWRSSAAVNGSPGAADEGGAVAASSRIINLSILTAIETSGEEFTMGYVVGGTGTTGAKPLVIRAAGPSLGALGVPGTLADPKLELYAGSTKTSDNNDWGGSASLANAMAAVGAFAYTGPTSLDAAAAVNISTRDNSVKVSANGSGTGLVIAEVYDATPEASVTGATPRLINVSVLKNIGSGLTAGFVIRGGSSRTVLIRAIGPTLADFGVGNVISDPQLTLFRGQTAIGRNDNWGATAELSAAFTVVGAFDLPGASLDAAYLATLTPGEYTVQVTGVGGAAGTALVEVYEVP